MSAWPSKQWRPAARPITVAPEARAPVAPTFESAMIARAIVELGRKRPADPRFDRIDELPAAEADIMFDGFLRRRRVANPGQQLGEQLVALELAFEEDSVEVEDDRVKAQGLNPRTARCRPAPRSRRA